MSGSHEGHDCPNLEGKTADELRDMILASAIDFAVRSRTYYDATKKHKDTSAQMITDLLLGENKRDFAGTLEEIARNARAVQALAMLEKSAQEPLHTFVHAAEAYAMALGKVEPPPEPVSAAQEAASE